MCLAHAVCFVRVFTFAMNLQTAKGKAVSCQMLYSESLVFCKALLELHILAL